MKVIRHATWKDVAKRWIRRYGGRLESQDMHGGQITRFELFNTNGEYVCEARDSNLFPQNVMQLPRNEHDIPF